MCSLGFLAWDYSSEAFLASVGSVAIAELGDKTQLLECTSRLRKQARRDNIVPIVSVAPTLEDGQPMADVAPSIDNETSDRALVRAEMRRLLERAWRDAHQPPVPA